VRINEIIDDNMVLMSLYDLDYQNTLESLKSALYMKEQLQKLESNTLYNGAVKQLLEPIYPLARFIVSVEWIDPDPDMQQLKRISQSLLD
jgi:hypothetical protein